MSEYVKIILVVDKATRKAIGCEVKEYRNIEHVVKVVQPRLKPVKDTPAMNEVLMELLRDSKIR